jgi:hypothetical protein
MCLDAKTYLGGHYEHNKVEGKLGVTLNGKPIDVDPQKVVAITECIARLPNAWVWDNYMGNTCTEWGDTSVESYVERSVIEELYDIVTETLRTNDFEFAEDNGLGIPSDVKDEYNDEYNVARYVEELISIGKICLEALSVSEDKYLIYYSV